MTYGPSFDFHMLFCSLTLHQRQRDPCHKFHLFSYGHPMFPTMNTQKSAEKKKISTTETGLRGL